MNQTFVYRKHLRAPFKSFVRIVMLMFLGIFIMTFGLIFTNHEKMNSYVPFVFGIVILIMFFCVLLEAGFFYHFLYKQFQSINITLTDDAIVYNTAKKQIIIPYEDIKKLAFPSIKYTGGWIKIVYKGGNIRLTVVLEHIGDFIYELKEKLDQREMSQVYNEKKLFSFFKTAVFADGSWERVYHNYKFQLAISYLSIIITTLIIRFFDHSNNSNYFIYVSILAPLLGYLFSEIIIGIKLNKQFITGELKLFPRYPIFEHKVFKISIMVFSIGYILILLVAVI